MRNTNPQLDPAGPADNGGPTLTIALLPGSPALNAGNDALAPKLDQRSSFVRAGVSDIGAYEFAGGPLRITSITRKAKGETVLQGRGVPGAVHAIERSLAAPAGAAFGHLAPTTADSAGVIQFTDTTATDLETGFYRLAFP